MNGFEQIQQGVEEGNLISYLVGLNDSGEHDFHVPYISESYQYMDRVMNNINEYHKTYPEKKTNEVYEKTIKEMVSDNERPLICFYALESLRWQLEYEERGVASFRINDAKQLLIDGLKTLKQNRGEIVYFITRLGRTVSDYDDLKFSTINSINKR